MPKYGFLSVLKEEMDKHFHYDYALDWNKKNHAVELSLCWRFRTLTAWKPLMTRAR